MSFKQKTVHQTTTIISIANTRIGSKEIPGAPRINRNLLDDKELATSCFIPVREPFTSLAISEGKEQVKAAALQIDKDMGYDSARLKQ